MSSSRQSWMESNRRLWTSSPEINRRASPMSSILDDIPSTEDGSVCSASQGVSLRDVIAMVAKESQTSGGGLLSSRAESGLASLLSDTDAGDEAATPIKQLVSVLLATNARRRADGQEHRRQEAAAQDWKDGVRSVVAEIAQHLRGEAPEPQEEVQDSLYRVLLDVEKCEELAQVATKVRASSLRATLMEACGGQQLQPTQVSSLVSAAEGVQGSAALPHTVDLLESHGFTIMSDADVPEAVLQLIKDVERFRRESSFLGIVLQQYEQTVRSRLAAHGETEPPLAEAEKVRLATADQTGITTAAVDKTAEKPSLWWEPQASRVCEHLSRMSPAITGQVLPPPGPLDVSSDAVVTRRSITTFLDATDASLGALYHECTRSKERAEALVESLRVASLLPAEDKSSTSSQQAVPTSTLLAHLQTQVAQTLGIHIDKPNAPASGHYHDSASTTHGSGNSDAAEAETCFIPPLKLLALVIESLPTAVRSKFALEAIPGSSLSSPLPAVTFNEERAAQLLAAVTFLSEHNRDTIHRIDALCDRLRGTFHMSETADAADRTLADQLAFLEDAVSAACQRSVEAVSSESALTREVRQSIEELAQLLPISPVSSGATGPLVGGDTAAIRIAAPTTDLLEMTRLLKSRVLDWQQAQAKRSALGGHYKRENSRLEESVRTFTSTAQGLLDEILAMVPVEADVVAGSGVARAATAEKDDAASDDELSHKRGKSAVHREGENGNVDESSASPSVAAVVGGGGDAATLENVLERLKLARTRHVRLVRASDSLRGRLNTATTQTRSAQKVTRRLVKVVDSICETLSISLGPVPCAAPDEVEKGKKKVGTGTPSSKDKGVCGKLDLRPERRASTPTAGAPTIEASRSVTEENIVEALQRVAERITSDETLVRKSVQEGELERLREIERRAATDRAAFYKALEVILTRLAENGKLVKKSLYLLGTDESPKDDVVETVLRKDTRESKSERREAQAEQDSDEDSADSREQQHAENERLLASLLQKYARWSRRLMETTEDHLDTQQKLVKYFAAVRRYFVSLPQATSSETDEAAGSVMDENLIDIDTTLMRFADVILPALDRALRQGVGAGAPRGSDEVPLLPPSRESDMGSDVGAPVSLPAVEGLPYDHRLGRLYEMIGRLHIIVTSLLRVRYLSVPTGTRQRSSGETELLFDAEDSIGSGFVDLDLDKLVRVSAVSPSSTEVSQRSARGDGVEPERFSRDGRNMLPVPSPPPPPTQESRHTSAGGGSTSTNKAVQAMAERISANNDLIYRVSTQNLDCVYQAMRKFSASHKMAAILIQKDTDAVQDRLGAMLETYSELDIEQAFGQDRQELRGIYTMLKERSARQKGCYFFNRVNGEGECPWTKALDRLSVGFTGVVDKLVGRTTALARSRDLVRDIVDICALYVNWTETVTLPEGRALPEDVLADCVRGDSEPRVGGDSPRAKGQGDTAGKLPPIPPGDHARDGRALAVDGGSALTPSLAGRAKVSYFGSDDTVLKVIANMFQVAQEAVEATGHGANRSSSSGDREAQQQQLEEELELLKEARTLAEQRAARLERERAGVEAAKDQACSEAAVAKAELRRWKRRVEARYGEGFLDGTDTCDNESDNAAFAAGTPRTIAPVTTNNGADTKPYEGVSQQETLQEMLQYMKALSEEVEFARRVAGIGAPSDTDYPHPDPTATEEEDEDDEDSAYQREMERRFSQQYGHTPLRVVAERNHRRYADATQSSRGASARNRPADATPTRARDGFFFSDKTPRAFASSTSGNVRPVPHRRTNTPSSTAGVRSRGSHESLSGAPRVPSYAPEGYARDQRDAPQQYRTGATGAASANRGHGASRHQTPPPTPRSTEDFYFDADPVLSALPSPPKAARPRARHVSPGSLSTAASRTPASAGHGQPRGGLTGALQTIREEETRTPGARPRTASANSNVRAAALRRLAEVVSKTKVRGPDGNLF